MNSSGQQIPIIGSARDPKTSKTARVQIGDAHLLNCNMCGSYQPKSGALTIRNK